MCGSRSRGNECLFSDWTIGDRSRLTTTGNWKLKNSKTLNSRHETLLAAVLVVWAVCSATTEPKPGAKNSRDWDRKMSAEVAQTIPGSISISNPISPSQVQQDDQVNFETGGPIQTAEWLSMGVCSLAASAAMRPTGSPLIDIAKWPSMLQVARCKLHVACCWIAGLQAVEGWRMRPRDMFHVASVSSNSSCFWTRPRLMPFLLRLLLLLMMMMRPQTPSLPLLVDVAPAPPAPPSILVSFCQHCAHIWRQY
ncbi:uncharacterized protein LOC6533236 isoform X1 [Drosophila yakuba]|uniref:Uncharacterized protein, isoform B n=1 Tax=Drosophila yakuba TaxID=7245 RepID=A0A0R1DWJ9_DROYA|nr:uncharacterized protein LOC6533236 isoform X1 [Drosophila yakuba]KRK01295.1 uncharacterized protein Dyak_GE21577, isoform B [Drosophila yakuba]